MGACFSAAIKPEWGLERAGWEHFSYMFMRCRMRKPQGQDLYVSIHRLELGHEAGPSPCSRIHVQ
jgi:hypothetical protein